MNDATNRRHSINYPLYTHLQIVKTASRRRLHVKISKVERDLGVAVGDGDHPDAISSMIVVVRIVGGDDYTVCEIEPTSTVGLS